MSVPKPHAGLTIIVVICLERVQRLVQGGSSYETPSPRGNRYGMRHADPRIRAITSIGQQLDKFRIPPDLLYNFCVGRNAPKHDLNGATT